jgi:UDP-N-acetyl-D-galactosamine dehydrogenase
VDQAKVLILGLAFKENCPDLRNTKVIDILRELSEYHMEIDVYDPWVNAAEARHEYGITPVEHVQEGKYDAIILAVAHRQFRDLGAAGIRRLGKEEHILYDLKYVLGKEESDSRL